MKEKQKIKRRGGKGGRVNATICAEVGKVGKNVDDRGLRISPKTIYPTNGSFFPSHVTQIYEKLLDKASLLGDLKKGVKSFVREGYGGSG